MKDTNHCDHLRVLIVRTIRGLRRGYRTIGGRCQDCGHDVRRQQNPTEIRTHLPQTVWR